AFKRAGFSDPYNYAESWGASLWSSGIHDGCGATLLGADFDSRSTAYAIRRAIGVAGDHPGIKFSLENVRVAMNEWRAKQVKFFELMKDAVEGVVEVSDGIS